MKPKVSVIIITKNNAHEIRNCLESVKWADEIVVVDSFSTDDTAAICRDYTDKIFQHAFLGYSEQLNLCLEKTSHDWIFNVYADEVISPQLGQEIEALFATGGPPLNGYKMIRSQYLHKRLLKRSGYYPLYELRLFRKSKGGFMARNPHQKVKVRGKVGHLRSVIEHHSWRNWGEIFDNFMEYAKIEAKWAFDHGERVNLLSFLLLPLEFLRRFIVKRGFLDGILGIVICGRRVAYDFIKYALMWELQNERWLEEKTVQK